MAQYDVYGRIEKKYLEQMKDILRNYYNNLGYANIGFKNQMGEDLDFHNCVDIQLKIDNKIINVSLRCREQLKWFDITLRNTASDSGAKSEWDKIKDGECKAGIMLFCWCDKNTNKVVHYAIMDMSMITFDELNKLKKPLKYNKYPDGTLDGSSFCDV